VQAQALVTAAGLRRGIRNHDLSGRTVVVHSSLASFGAVDGGADVVVQAFLSTPLPPSDPELAR
jgi:aminoglycoside N3'-acetyltransferase